MKKTWRIKVMYHDGKKIFAPYYKVKFLFFSFWIPIVVSHNDGLAAYIDCEWYDTFFTRNCLGFYSEDDARTYIKRYEERCKLAEQLGKTEPEYIYIEDEPDGNRTDKD